MSRVDRQRKATRTVVVRLTANESAMLEAIARELHCDAQAAAQEAVCAFIRMYEPPSAQFSANAEKTSANAEEAKRAHPGPEFDVVWDGSMKVAPSDAVRS